jgi:multiple sugar transport system ATP-binding protein
VHPKDRDIAMVFQSYALYPHMTVYDNIAFGLQIRKLAGQEIKRRVQVAADTLGLTGFLERKPKALSGGQRQRVALGRAIVRNPSVFLFDEPLSNLDAELRVHMRAELSQLQRRLNTTTVYVTHDQVEAMTMGHRIAVLRPCGADPRVGNLTQCGTPMEIYDAPANLFTARFMGTPRMNTVSGRIAEDGTEVQFFGVRAAVPPQFRQAAARHRGREVVVGIRSEHIGAEQEIDWTSQTRLTGDVEIVEPLGHEVIVHLKVSGESLAGRLRSHASLPAAGAPITLLVKTEAMHLFDPATEQRLS